MQQKIFELKLSTQATSLYLLLASLAVQELRLDRSLALNFWNASEGELDAAFLELNSRGVLAENEGAWLIQPAAKWA
jgi:hypothetical protein